MSEMLVFRDVCKDYGDVAAVDCASFTLTRGAFLAVIGESGSGKTTTVKMINRLVEPTSGVIEVAGTNVRERPAHQLRREIGYLPQGAGLFPHLDVASNIAVTPRLLGWDDDRIRNRVCTLLELVRLDPDQFADRKPAELSGGQRQRVGFARALAAESALVLLDEPFSALDPATREELQADFTAIHRDLGLTTVMVTHDMAEALTMADTIIVMREGRILQHGTARDLTETPADDYVARLIDTPRRQAEALNAALGGAGL